MYVYNFGQEFKEKSRIMHTDFKIHIKKRICPNSLSIDSTPRGPLLKWSAISVSPETPIGDSVEC